MNRHVLDKYFKYDTMVRDLVHGYINLSRFDLELIDTPYFQRLKDIRQLTCQEVYPSARHTRFEHSLGVLELTRQSIDSINRNGFFCSGRTEEDVIPQYLAFTTSTAALLHDIGHCPYSHLGEQQFDKEEVAKRLAEIILQKNLSSFEDAAKKRDEDKEVADAEKRIRCLANTLGKYGSTHELISCIIISSVYEMTIRNAVQEIDGKPQGFDPIVHIIRCIIGYKYENVDRSNMWNLTISLINSDILDMDKIDYIMRDSKYTGLNVPEIDTKRLFANMCVERNISRLTDDYTIVYTSKAVPVLQSIIDTRDNLYMWVYNHHTVVYTDFIFAHILRKFKRNFQRFRKLEFAIKDDILEQIQIYDGFYNGLMNPESIFSVDAILDKLVSDSNIIALFKKCRWIYNNDEARYAFLTETPDDSDDSKLKKQQIIGSIERTMEMIEAWMKRDLLKPWWKNIYEYNNFLSSNFRSDTLRRDFAQWICQNGNAAERENAANFRSLVSKLVIALAKKDHRSEMINQGDFFIVERSNHFNEIEDIDKLYIILKDNEVLSESLGGREAIGHVDDSSVYFLSNLLPQKEYSKIYAKDGFYIYLRPYVRQVSSESETTDFIEARNQFDVSYTSTYAQKEREYYQAVKEIFISVGKKMASMSCDRFDRFYKDMTSPGRLDSITLKELENWT